MKFLDHRVKQIFNIKDSVKLFSKESTLFLSYTQQREILLGPDSLSSAS